MKLLHAISIALLAVSCASEADSPIISLFNGKDLTGWEAHGCGKFYVDENHCLVTESGPENEYGYLVTDRNYDDFDLRATPKTHSRRKTVS